MAEKIIKAKVKLIIWDPSNKSLNRALLQYNLLRFMVVFCSNFLCTFPHLIYSGFEEIWNNIEKYQIAGLY